MIRRVLSDGLLKGGAKPTGIIHIGSFDIRHGLAEMIKAKGLPGAWVEVLARAQLAMLGDEDLVQRARCVGE